MKRRISVLLLFAAALYSCEKLPPAQQEIDISTQITDLKGLAVKETGSGNLLKISAPELVEWNKQGLLKKNGYVLFDTVRAAIKEAADDFILTAVPIMNYTDSRYIDIRLSVSQRVIARLCNACIFYRPRVTGTIFSGFTGGVTDGTFQKPAEMTNDAAGNIYVIDQRTTNDVILKISTTGAVTSFAGGANEFGRLVGIGIDNSRNLLYVADATSQQVKSVNLTGAPVVSVLAGSGVAGNTDGTGTAASFRFGNQQVSNFSTSENGQGLTVDAMGDIYVGENYSATYSSQVRKITPAGLVTTVPGSRVLVTASEDESAMPAGITTSPAGDIFTCSGSSGLFQGVNRFPVAGSGLIRLAGKDSFEGLDDGTGGTAQFSYPKAIDYFNNFLFVADGTNGALRRVNSAGKVITLAGVGHFNTNSFRGGGFLPPLEGSFLMEGILAIPDPNYYENAARVIRMDQAGGVTVVNGGLIYVSDYGYKCVWKIEIR